MSETRDTDLRVIIVWEPILKPDGYPSDETRRRVTDNRTRHFWDPERSVGKMLLPVLQADHEGFIGKESLMKKDPVWDMAGYYRAGVRWDDVLPSPTVKGAPVVQTLERIAEAMEQEKRMLERRRRVEQPTR